MDIQGTQVSLASIPGGQATHRGSSPEAPVILPHPQPQAMRMMMRRMKMRRKKRMRISGTWYARRPPSGPSLRPERRWRQKGRRPEKEKNREERKERKRGSKRTFARTATKKKKEEESPKQESEESGKEETKNSRKAKTKEERSKEKKAQRKKEMLGRLKETHKKKGKKAKEKKAKKKVSSSEKPQKRRKISKFGCYGGHASDYVPWGIEPRVALEPQSIERPCGLDDVKGRKRSGAVGGDRSGSVVLWVMALMALPPTSFVVD
eukprot:g31535.t1